MEIESRPRRSSTTTTTTTTSELFVCFTSRLSHSSSMRLSSKSILSPGHSSADKSAASLSSSLSRRLRHNGSLRQSPAMFPSKKTRGGSGFDNPEPSSPKVTCIGQVRVKTKKQGKKMKMRACRSSKRLSSGGGDASFRRIEGLMRQNSSQQQQDCMLNQRNQRWVHLPLTICEALRAFGAEFSCLLPCKSSCFSSCGGGERGKGGKDSGESCGGVFRWLVAFQDGEGQGEGRERDIELVVEEEVEEVERIDCSSRRRSIFDDMEFKDEIFHVQNEGKQDELTERGRVSVCVPPKNALLLMRCRSDPAKMSALSHKIWEPPLAQPSDSDEDEVEAVEVEAEKEKEKEEEEIYAKMEEKTGEIEKLCGDCVVIDANVEGYEMGTEELAISTVEEEEEEEKQDEEEEEETQGMENIDKTEKIAAVLFTGKVDENEPYRCSIDAITIRKMFEEKTDPDFTNDETKTLEMGDLSSSSSSSSVQESTAETQQDEENVNSMEKAKERDEEEEEEEELSKPDPIPCETLKEVKKKVLPDCLLLMMCEPKLSMEVSKETWVCSTDFIRWLPHTKKPTKIDASNEPKKKRKPPPPIQPGRSSISFPTGGVEQKLVKTGVGYEPLVLPRCKSAPLRSTAKIAPPEMACSMWRRENVRKMEPHRPATYGVGAAGVGF